MPIVLTPISADDPISAYTTSAAVDEMGGPTNVAAYFGKDGQNDTDETVHAAKVRAGGQTDADINLAWRKRLKTAGTTFALLSSFTLDADEASWLSETAAMGIIVRGYRGRGQSDTGREFEGQMADLWNEYQRRLGLIESGDVLLDAQDQAGVTEPDATDAGTIRNVSMSFEPECSTDEYGRGCA